MYIIQSDWCKFPEQTKLLLQQRNPCEFLLYYYKLCTIDTCVQCDMESLCIIDSSTILYVHVGKWH